MLELVSTIGYKVPSLGENTSQAAGVRGNRTKTQTVKVLKMSAFILILCK